MMWIAILVIGIILALLLVFVRFTVVQEGSAKAVMMFGKFSKIIFCWEDHWMDTESNIWRRTPIEEGSKDKEERRVFDRIIGGLFVYFWPFQNIHHYIHRWSDIRLIEDKMKIEFHEEESFGHVLLKPAVYAFKLTAVETKPPERIPVDVLVLATIRIRNPYLFLFVAPPTPIEDILARISAETRALVTSCQIDDLLQLKGASLWKLLTGAKVIEETLEKWGVKLAERGIEIREINLPPEYQKAGAAKKEQEMRAAGRAEEITGTVIAAVARAEGIPESKIQKEFRQNPEQFYKKHKSISDNTMTKLSMEEKSYLRIETPGATGMEGAFLTLIGALQRMPKGKPNPAEDIEKINEEKSEKVIKETEEQKEEELTGAQKEIIKEARRRGIDPKEPLERWRQKKKN